MPCGSGIAYRRSCRSALGRDAFLSVFGEHRGHGPLLQRHGRCSVGAPSGAMLSCPCSKSIAGMARSYKAPGDALEERPRARCLPVRVRRASRAWPAPTRLSAVLCRSALGRDAFRSVFEGHHGHGPLLQGHGVGQGEIAVVQGVGGESQVRDVAVVDDDVVGQGQPVGA